MTTPTGPFGLIPGSKVADLPQLEELAPFKYVLKAPPPKPHSSFETYIVQVTPIAGLSWVKAIGKTISTNGFGIEVQSAFEAMRTRLEAVYGTQRTTDRLLQGSIWNEPQDWLMALSKGERMLAAIWNGESRANLGYRMKTVALMASSLDSSSGYITVEYDFDNREASNNEATAAEDDAL